MKEPEYFAWLQTSVVITELYNVMFNSGELIGSYRICDVIDEMTLKPMSL